MVKLGLSASELLVYALIYSYSGNGNAVFYAPMDYLAKRTALSRKTVERTVKKLILRGLIVRCERNGQKGLATVMTIKDAQKEKEQRHKNSCLRSEIM